MKDLFDENGLLNIDILMEQTPSWKSIIADELVTNEELKEQSERVMRLAEKLQAACNQEQIDLVKAFLAELNVLNMAYHYNSVKPM